MPRDFNLWCLRRKTLIKVGGKWGWRLNRREGKGEMKSDSKNRFKNNSLFGLGIEILFSCQLSKSQVM